MSYSEIFKDKAFEQMDDMVQMLEPYEYSVNDIISIVPDSIDIDAKMLKYIISRHYRSMSTFEIIANYCTTNNLYSEPELYKLKNTNLNDMFKIECEEETIFDVENSTLDKDIKLIKIKNGLDDKEILDLYKRTIQNSHHVNKSTKKTNLKELAELFGAEIQPTKHGTYVSIKNKIIELIDSNELNIKNVDLFMRFSSYIGVFLQNGSLPALANIAKIKIMSRKGDPIYSIKEEEV
jgi:hypothetical protein